MHWVRTMKKLWHLKLRYLITAVIILAVYVGTYCLLSWNGRYWYRPSGEVRYGSGLAAFELAQWSPYGITFECRHGVDGKYITDGGVFGFIYSPLIYVDRRLVHKTRRYIEVPENEWVVNWW